MTKTKKQMGTDLRSGVNQGDAGLTAEAPAPESSARSHVRNFVLLVATSLGAFLCYLMAMPFVPALGWALALAVMFAPLQERLELRFKSPSLAATLSVLAVGLILLVPATFVAQQLVAQAADGAQRIDSLFESGAWRRVLDTQPRLATLAAKIEKRVDLPGAAKSLASWLSKMAASIIKGSVFQVLGFCLVLYLLFFFLRDRAVALHSIRSLSPLSHQEMDRVFSRVNDTIHATIYGTLAVSLVQGLLGGLMFWWLGLPAALLWGVVMALLAVVPILGAFVVWVPAAVFLALDGSWGKALLLTFWGLIVVSTVDNLLYPMLVGKRLKMHTVLAFVSVVGGLMVFGPVGLILGPVVLTITIALLEIWPDPSTAIQE